MNAPFTVLRAAAAPLPLEDVNTDLIWPARPNISLERGKQGANAFATLRFDPSGAEIPGFILNRAPWRQARILVAGRNFGCGSSRELAVWALVEYGFRCVIAPSFGDIFYNNASLNGLLPVILAEDKVSALLGKIADPAQSTITVDLQQLRVTAEGFDAPFSIDRHRRECLLNGLDEITATLREQSSIAAFARTYEVRYPWSRP